MIRTEIGIAHLEKVKALLDQYENFNEKKALNAIGHKFKNRIVQNFRATRDPYGRKWAPLKYRNGTALDDTGDMKASIRFRVINNVLRLGTDKEYAIWHQAGTKRIPKRAFLPDQRGLPDSWADEAASILEQYFLNPNL